jgi:hypothetical protein
VALPGVAPCTSRCRAHRRREELPRELPEARPAARPRRAARSPPSVLGGIRLLGLGARRWGSSPPSFLRPGRPFHPVSGRRRRSVRVLPHPAGGVSFLWRCQGSPPAPRGAGPTVGGRTWGLDGGAHHPLPFSARDACFIRSPAVVDGMPASSRIRPEGSRFCGVFSFPEALR